MEVFIVFIIRLPNPFPTDLYVFIVKFYRLLLLLHLPLKKCLRKIFEVFRMLCNCQILKNTVIFGSFYRIHYPVAQPFPTDLYVFIVKFYRLLLLLHLPLKKCLRKIFEVFRMLCNLSNIEKYSNFWKFLSYSLSGCPIRSQPIYTCSSLNSTPFVTTAPSFKKMSS